MSSVQRISRYRKYLICLGIITLLLALAVISLSVAVSFLAESPQNAGISQSVGNTEIPWPEPSDTALRTFTKAAVVADNGLCSEVGRQILLRGGNAMDAVVATNICQGALNSQSSGIGGGFFLTYFDRKTGSCSTVDAREAAPLKSEQVTRDKVYSGWSAMGVPGEVSGMWRAHSQFGRLPWKDLFAPTVRHLRQGFPLSGALVDCLNYGSTPKSINNETGLDIYLNQTTRKLLKEGDLMKRPVLAQTLENLANSPDPEKTFYQDMAKIAVQEIQKAGGLLTVEDFGNYSARLNENLVKMSIGGTGVSMCGPGPPSSSAVIAAILNVLSGMDISPQNLSSVESAGELYNNFVEASKFAYAARSYFGDPRFVNGLDQKVANITSSSWGAWVRSQIPDQSQPVTYYGGKFSQVDDTGTTHMSVVDADGNAAAITASVNFYFGAKVRSKQLGIIWNNQLADFSFPLNVDGFGFFPSQTNYPAPGKRPLSSMSPVIFCDEVKKKPKMTLGAAGGSRIISSVSYAAMRLLWLNETVKEAIDAPRFHNQLTPSVTRYETNMPKEYPKYLRERHGQETEKDTPREKSVICGIRVLDDGRVTANSDFRKPGGYPAGY